MKEIVIIGAGNFGKEVAWLIEDINKYKPTYIVLGFLDDEKKQGQNINGYDVLGSVAYLEELNRNHHACAVIAMQNGLYRKKIVESLPAFEDWETLIHPSVSISETSQIGFGSIIAAGSYVSVNSKVGNQCVLNMGSIIENDCVIDDYASIMTKTLIGSHSKICRYAYVASGAVITSGRIIGKESQVGPGSVVINDVADGVNVMGVPAKKGLFDTYTVLQ